MVRNKNILFLAALLALVVTAALVFLWTNINWIVKTAIEQYGSQVTGTAVRVASVAITPAKGMGAIEGLTVANPGGFSASHVLSLGSISVRINPRTITSSPVVIEDIRISAPQILYETDQAGRSNIDALKKNIEASASGAKRPVEKKKAPGRETRLRIRKLVIESSRVEMRVGALGNRPQYLTLGRVEVTDIGGPAGAAPDVVARQVLNAIMTEVSREIAGAGVKQLFEKGLKGAVDQMQRRK